MSARSVKSAIEPGSAIGAYPDNAAIDLPALPPTDIHLNTESGRHLVLITAVLICVTILQRFAVPVAEGQFGFGFLFGLVIAVWLVLRGSLHVNAERLVTYIVVVVAIMLVLFANTNGFSTSSLGMLFIVYSLYIFELNIDIDEYISILKSYQKIMMICVYCGLVQFFIQFALGQNVMFPFDMILPDSFFIPGFNLRIPIDDSLPYLKSTGLWFLEPSHFSQFLAIAIVIELKYFNRLSHLGLYAFSMILCFSGTGVMLLGLIVPIFLVMRGRFGVIAVALLGLISIIVFRDVFPFSVFFDRLADFSNPLASGSGRFLAPYWLVDELMQHRPGVLLWGLGPGEMEKIAFQTDYFLQDSSWMKLWIEYGIISLTCFGLFFLYSLFVRSPDRVLSLAFLIQFLFLGGYLLSFYVHFLYLALVVWPQVRRERGAGQGIVQCSVARSAVRTGWSDLPMDERPGSRRGALDSVQCGFARPCGHDTSESRGAGIPSGRDR